LRRCSVKDTTKEKWKNVFYKVGAQNLEPLPYTIHFSTTGMIAKITSLVALIVAIAGFYILLKYQLLFSTHPITIAIQALAIALMIWARITLGWRSFHGSANTTGGNLVTNGPYQYWRHPIYASIIYFIWASVISYPYVLTIVVAITVTMAIVSRALLEEYFLLKAYPEYEAYAKRTKRIIPYVV